MSLPLGEETGRNALRNSIDDPKNQSGRTAHALVAIASPFLATDCRLGGGGAELAATRQSRGERRPVQRRPANVFTARLSGGRGLATCPRIGRNHDRIIPRTV